ncbi:MFS transporter [Caballeronia sp. LP006]|uniref:MFS transporter n=1 Tax=Caballeronia sp. LP006 TaxID=3038552 RepID=UPI00285444A8|nr:MFS transporter [Caballeronia sp. LP006]MDR5832355.1 MFS transporter [Caballeronia sp. LP006]
MVKVAIASMAGATLEWYDFTLYNAMAALVFNRLFFPQFDPLVGTILAFSTYAVGYISRPIGGVVFGWAGNKYGRKAVLLVTLLMMGVSSLVIGLLPTYDTIGVAAPLLLVALRFFQGMALGGDWAAAVLLSSESGSASKRGFNASFAQTGPAAGTLLATATLWLVTTILTSEEFAIWGWRIPFVLSVLLVFVGMWIRRAVAEPASTTGSLKKTRRSSSPIREVFRLHLRSLLVAGGVRIGSDVLYAVVATFSLTYVSQVLKLPRSIALAGVLSGATAQLFLIPAFGALSDRFGRRPLYFAGIAAGVLASFAVFTLFNTRDASLIAIAVVLGMTAHAAMYGVQAALVTEQFDARVRFAGSSLAYTFAGVLGGGFAPLVISTLYARFNSTLFISLYVMGALAVSAIALMFARPAERNQA